MIFNSKPIIFFFKPKTPKIGKELEPQGGYLALTIVKPSFRKND